MILTFSECQSRMIPFYDAASPGELCGVPCWPERPPGNDPDCEGQRILVGVLGNDGMFRAEEEDAFTPSRVIWTCPSEPAQEGE